LAAVSSIMIGVLILWRLVWESSGNQLDTQAAETQSTQWFLFAAANLHIAWIFGLSVACYYRSRQQVMSLAREDALTALPNRRWIDEMLNQALIEAKCSGEKFAVIMLDINKFKLVNDKFGHSTGDKVLTEVAERLRKAVRESDFAGRLGGDEFVVLARRIDSDLLLTQMVDRIRHQLNGKMALSDEEIDIRVSIGTAVFPVEGDTADMLLGVADAGMYRDKKSEKKDS
ncbi:MAG: GGDEF domain-containing protein, partial [Pseudohongiella sp.]|nr:GGDEF domain-containing protein [Pseudohongiella sp.]